MPRKLASTPKSPVRDIAESWARERPDLRPIDYLIPIYLLRIGRILDRRDDLHCQADHEVSGAEMRVLFALRRLGPPYSRRPTDLFRALLVTSGAITKQVDRLEARGLVQRLQDPDNGGGFLIRLTEAGRRRADAALSEVAKSSQTSAMAAVLTEDERQTLLRLCQKLLIGIEEEMESAE